MLTNGPGKAPYLYITLNNTETIWGLGGPGVYEATSLNQNNTIWTLYGEGLPDALVNDLPIIPGGSGTGVLLASLWGRGAWQIPIIH